MSTTHIITRGTRRFRLNEMPGAYSIPLAVSTWATRVVTNGGAAVSSATINSVSIFYQGLIDYSLLSKMKSVNCFVPDNLIACTTPLIVNGNDPWTNSNFVNGDLTVDGLKGNGSNKKLTPGILPTSVFTTASAGFTLYVPEVDASADDEIDIGCANSATQLIYIATKASDSKLIFDCFNNTVGQGRIAVANPGPGLYAGYFSGNRTGANASALYLGSSVTPHYAVGSIVTGGGTVPTNTIEVWGAASSYSTNRISFAAIHNGLTESQSLAFFSLIQTLRQNFGGGYV